MLCTWHTLTASAAHWVHIYLYISYREIFIYLWHAGWGADRLSSHHGGVWNATRILSVIALEILASPGEPAVDQLCITVCHSGRCLQCFGTSWGSHHPHKHIFPGTPGAAEHSAPPGLHLLGPGFADETFQFHLEEMYWLFSF